jgi:hypothetical protein
MPTESQPNPTNQGDEEPNDTYVEQLTAAGRAAVDELVRRGVADPKRISVGGHSYGAFMTANLLAHLPDVFAAGIARRWVFFMLVVGVGWCPLCCLQLHTYANPQPNPNTTQPIRHPAAAPTTAP